MDMMVKPVTPDGPWRMTDLLGRSMGVIAKIGGRFVITPEGHALETMETIAQGPFDSLDAALAEIERHTRGVCRLDQASSASIPVDNLNASNDE